MSIENVFITYRELRRDMKSFPLTSPMYIKAKKELNEYLESVADRYGKELVKQITMGKKYK